MKIMIVADGHYYRSPDNNIYVESVFDYEFYKRYTNIFKEIIVVARVKNIDYVPRNMKVASGKNIEFWDLPSYKGPIQYILKYREISKLAKQYSRLADGAIFRLPGATANIMAKEYAKLNKPFAIEVVVDPWEYFAKGTVKSFARPIVRIAWTKFLKKMCLTANGVSYVTEKYLQEKYPCKAIVRENDSCYFTANYSSVELRESSILSPKKHEIKDKYIVSHVANSFTGYGKGHKVLMDAIKIVKSKGYNVDVNFVGDGPLKDEFIEYSIKLGIRNNVNFLGRMSNGEEVRKAISSSDMFVFPTMAEGLPRVLLEAMSVGLPSISSPVCGIPEILPNKFLVSYDDPKGYANKIIELISKKDIYENASKYNIEISKKYTNTILEKRRNEFYIKYKNSINKN